MLKLLDGLPHNLEVMRFGSGKNPLNVGVDPTTWADPGITFSAEFPTQFFPISDRKEE